MEFFIRKDSIEPILKMQLVLDGRHDFQNFHNKLANSSIFFSMKDVDRMLSETHVNNMKIIPQTKNLYKNGKTNARRNSRFPTRK